MSNHIAKSRVWHVLGFAAMLLAYRNAAATNADWYVRIYPQNETYIEVIVVAGVQSNEYLANVRFVVSFFDADQKFVKAESFNFTDANFPQLRTGTYQRFFPHSSATGKSVRGDKLEWLPGIDGLAYKTEPRSAASKGSWLNEVWQGANTVGAVPSSNAQASPCDSITVPPEATCKDFYRERTNWDSDRTHRCGLRQVERYKEVLNISSDLEWSRYLSKCK